MVIFRKLFLIRCGKTSLHETYAGDELVEICIVGTGSTNNSSTFVRYPEGATCIKAVSWDGKREAVCGTCE